MRHRKAGKHLTRTSAHRRAMRRNLAQSLFEFGEIRTTLPKAKDARGFVERLITLARTNTLRARQRVTALLTDRAIIPADQQETYNGMSDAHRAKVLRSRSGRRHRIGAVPAAYNKKKISFVASSVIHKLFSEVAPRYVDRPGGYTRIIRLPSWRIGDNSDLAILQLVGQEAETAGKAVKTKTVSRRRAIALNRIRRLEGKTSGKRPSRKAEAPKTEAPAEQPPASDGTA